MLDDPRIAGLTRLVLGAVRPAPGRARIFLALFSGMLCHLVFAMAVIAMMGAMFFGMQLGLGTVSWPWAALVNLLLILQFPVVHSFLLTKPGRRLLVLLVPAPHGGVLSTTTYATIASAQLLALFALWSPSGVIWWQADGTAFWLLSAAYGGAWLLLIKASFDAGAEVQSGALGWMSLMAKVKPVFPDMPDRGLFRLIRQPIYVAFALTLWTVPVWTPDQLMLAVILTAYCVFAPMLKERRFQAVYGARFERYRAQVPYMLPRPAGAGRAVQAHEDTASFKGGHIARKREAD